MSYQTNPSFFENKTATNHTNLNETSQESLYTCDRSFRKDS